MSDEKIAEAIALLKAGLVWDADFEQIREGLLLAMLATELETAKLLIAETLLGDGQC